ncbi:hypothetical protein GCM10015535_00640 [Streptomyces gelaticus]|uniref:Uncharacterized protein n=1 Tax=Streptomyces gelaticus TaxID=285446 RepID=A0ABQ2VT67_9ACTN|nr:hypothetical protein GCM10015535_00640 [Streptomyces gelaticus]
MVQGVDAAAESGQDGGPQPVVLDDDRVESGGGALAPVAVEDAHRQHGGQGAIADLACHVTWQRGPVAFAEHMHLVERPQRGQRILRAQRRGGQSQYGTSYGRGQGNLAPSHGPPQVRAPPMTMEHAGQHPWPGASPSDFGKGHGGAAEIRMRPARASVTLAPDSAGTAADAARTNGTRSGTR